MPCDIIPYALNITVRTYRYRLSQPPQNFIGFNVLIDVYAVILSDRNILVESLVEVMHIRNHCTGI